MGELRLDERDWKERLFQQYWQRYGRLVLRVIRRCSPVIDEDLIQVGRIALWEAIITYDGKHGTAFTTWLWRLVRQRVLEWRGLHAYPVCVPYSAIRLGAVPDLTQVPLELDTYEIDEELSPVVPPTLTYQEEGYAQIEWEEYLQRVLNPVQLYCVLHYFGFIDGQPETLQEIGYRLGLSRQRVHQHLLSALRRIRFCL